MPHLVTLHTAASTILNITAYLMCVTLVGIGQTWLFKKLGDATAEEQGFLTLNPIKHIDIVGFIAMLLTGFGWGVIIPCDYQALGQGRYRMLRTSIAFLCAPLTCLILAVTMLLLFIALVPSQGVTSLLHASAAASTTSSFMLVLANLFIAIVAEAIALAMLYLIVNGFRLFVFIAIERNYNFVKSYPTYFMLFVPLLVCIFLGPLIQSLLWQLVALIAHAIATLFSLGH
jgi:low affinity Fe/Cu permease